ncbi:ATP-binding protein [Streptomyces sp. NPDC097619]|uniref:sensor histidine kinase n=1 Tax=Streptomyces sp. NPDC097619 TaxID=3157228 RepID=UPI0033197CEC
MSVAAAPAHRHDTGGAGMAWLEAAVGDGFAENLQNGLNRSRYARSWLSDRPSIAAASPTPSDAAAEGDPIWQERRRIACEVHDELGTALAAAARRIELHAIETEETSHLDAARHAIQQALAVTRRLTSRLQEQTVLPPLADVLQEFATNSAEAAANAPQIVFKCTGDERLLSDVCRRELFLAVREALDNAFRHAEAARVTVSLRFTRRWVHAGITDDGVGFDTAALLAPGYRTPGLRSMTDRIDSLGGRLAITSTPGTGTQIDVHLPLRPTP